MTREVPSPTQIALARIKLEEKQLGHDVSPMRRIECFRAAEAASPDERLQMSDGLTIEPEPSPGSLLKPGDAAFEKLPPEARIALFRGQQDAEKKSTAPAPAPFPVDDDFMALDPQERLTRYRAAKATGGA